MTKKHLIALADMIRSHNAEAHQGLTRPLTEFTTDQINALADFCRAENPAFKRDRWLGYIAGTNGKNGGAR